jgi:hypothetical protein
MRAICNVPIDSQAYGEAVDVLTGVVDQGLVRRNLDHELDEVALRLSNAEFCGRLLTVVKASEMRCTEGCEGACECDLGFVTEKERLDLREFYKASERKRAGWEAGPQKELQPGVRVQVHGPVFKAKAVVDHRGWLLRSPRVSRERLHWDPSVRCTRKVSGLRGSSSQPQPPSRGAGSSRQVKFDSICFQFVLFILKSRQAI